MTNNRIPFSSLQRGLPNTEPERDKSPRALWSDPNLLAQSADWKYQDGRIFLGATESGEFIGTKDNRHLLTVAGSRGGKGVSSILPNLLLYSGSVLVIDPKGENATESANRRGQGHGIKNGGLKQDIYVIDPFHAADVPPEIRGGFNPMKGLNVDDDNFVDDCDSIADALIAPPLGKENDHWNSSARMVLRAFIAWVAIRAPEEQRNLITVKRLLTLPYRAKDDEKGYKAAEGENPQESLIKVLDKMIANPEVGYGVPMEAATFIISLGDEERGSVFSTTRDNIGFLSSPQIAETLSGDVRSPNLYDWKMGGISVYLCLPANRLHRHFRFLRLFINRLMDEVENNPETPETPALMILDEMHVLGHMSRLETSVALIAGMGVRIWSIWQDFAQLKSIYKERWETFLGNASIFQSFALNDLTTLQYISDRLGDTTMLSKNIGEQSMEQSAMGFSGESKSTQNTPLITSDELAYYFSRQSNNQLIIYPGADPIMIKRVPYYTDAFKNLRMNNEQ